jgi:Uma2 family endonuclease
MLCPDAAYISPENMQALDHAERAGIPHVCPDFVIELLANWVRHESVERKMANCWQMTFNSAWLIDPCRRIVSTHEPNSAIRRVSESVIRGSGPVDGFAFDLDEIWRCYNLTLAEE